MQAHDVHQREVKSNQILGEPGRSKILPQPIIAYHWGNTVLLRSFQQILFRTLEGLFLLTRRQPWRALSLASYVAFWCVALAEEVPGHLTQTMIVSCLKRTCFHSSKSRVWGPGPSLVPLSDLPDVHYFYFFQPTKKSSQLLRSITEVFCFMLRRPF